VTGCNEKPQGDILSSTQHTAALFGGLSGRHRLVDGALAAHTPLVVAIHGGTYTSAYFDVPGASLMERAAANGIPIVAPDRPGYVDSPILPRRCGRSSAHAAPTTRKPMC
jgi:pimeloyl-ACP methyl ester carboxylesterase